MVHTLALTNMARLVLFVLVLLAARGLCDPIGETEDPVFLQRQLDLMRLYFNIHEPHHEESWKAIARTWTLEKNLEHFSNVTVVKTYVEMLEHQWVLPKAVPFNIHQGEHRYEAVTLFKILFSAKDYDTFYKTAVYLKEHVNEHLFAYVLHVAILNRKDTQGIFIPYLYEVFPSFFNNGEIMTTAQRINTHGYHNIDYYPSTYKWNENVVIRWNSTIWPYLYSSEAAVYYFTHDFGLNTLYYNLHVAQPSWLRGDLAPSVQEKRGESFWFLHKQLLARYYMERLSNGLGEIPELGYEVVKHGYTSGLVYPNGIPFPVRPNHMHLNQPEFIDEMQEIYDYEHRVRDVIDKGYVINIAGERIDLRVPEAIDVLGRLIQANVDSPNEHYYKDFISIWKKVLGNSLVHEHHYYHHYTPLVVPSVLEHYQTALRDPAFYMIWKRVLGLFHMWQQKLPHYKREELALPQVAIQKVEVDKMVTYFENTYMNITNYLHTSEEHIQETSGKMSVLVQHPRLNHKGFQIRVHVKSEVAKTVVVKFFLAPKYDGHNSEIPLHINSQNFLLLDEFLHELPAGETVITRNSADNENAGKDWASSFQVYETVQKALEGKERLDISHVEGMDKVVQRLLLPKGRVGGMPFVLSVYISEYRKPSLPNRTRFEGTTLHGLNTGVIRIDNEPLGYPFNRPVYVWQVEGLQNIFFQDILIHHKHTPEIEVPHAE